MINIYERIYEKVKQVISTWSDDTIYAVSFFVESNEEYSYRGFNNVSSFCVSYNTEEYCDGAGKYDEDRWNYAFWSQDETPIIDVSCPNELTDLLYDWYAENGILNLGFEDEAKDYDENYNYIGKGPVGHIELLNITAEVGRRLQEEEFFKKKFNKAIPIIVHGLEYAWYDIEATKRANPYNEAADFLKAMG